MLFLLPLSYRECYSVGPIDVPPRGASSAGLQRLAQASDPGTACSKS